MTLPSTRMAAPTDISDHSPKKSPSKDDGHVDQQIQPKKLEEQEESSLNKINDNDSEVVKGSDETTKPTTALASEQEAALNLVTDISTVVGGDSVAAEDDEESGRERLRKHRLEMAGRVWIPDTWGQEGLLKDWIDCSAFDGSLVNNTILSARAALMQQRSTTTPANNPTLLTTIDNRC